MRAGPDRLTRVLSVLWPAFVAAGVLEALVFVVVDPGALHWFGRDPVSLTPQGVYSVTFLIFWGVISIAGAITALLLSPDPGP